MIKKLTETLKHIIKKLEEVDESNEKLEDVLGKHFLKIKHPKL